MFRMRRNFGPKRVNLPILLSNQIMGTKIEQQRFIFLDFGLKDKKKDGHWSPLVSGGYRGGARGCMHPLLDFPT